MPVYVFEITTLEYECLDACKRLNDDVLRFVATHLFWQDGGLMSTLVDLKDAAGLMNALCDIDETVERKLPERLREQANSLHVRLASLPFDEAFRQDAQ